LGAGAGAGFGEGRLGAGAVLATGVGAGATGYAAFSGGPTATVDATEEAVLNALWAAEEMTGRAGRVVQALPHGPVLDLLRSHGRLPA